MKKVSLLLMFCLSALLSNSPVHSAEVIVSNQKVKLELCKMVVDLAGCVYRKFYVDKIQNLIGGKYCEENLSITFVDNYDGSMDIHIYLNMNGAINEEGVSPFVDKVRTVIRTNRLESFHQKPRDFSFNDFYFNAYEAGSLHIPGTMSFFVKVPPLFRLVYASKKELEEISFFFANR